MKTTPDGSTIEAAPGWTEVNPDSKAAEDTCDPRQPGFMSTTFDALEHRLNRIDARLALLEFANTRSPDGQSWLKNVTTGRTMSDPCAYPPDHLMSETQKWHRNKDLEDERKREAGLPPTPIEGITHKAACPPGFTIEPKSAIFHTGLLDDPYRQWREDILKTAIHQCEYRERCGVGILESAKPWWPTIKADRLAKQRRSEVRQMALSKLTEEERKELGV